MTESDTQINNQHMCSKKDTYRNPAVVRRKISSNIITMTSFCKGKRSQHNMSQDNEQLGQN